MRGCRDTERMQSSNNTGSVISNTCQSALRELNSLDVYIYILLRIAALQRRYVGEFHHLSFT